jgi:hypothetical protein
MREVAEQVGTDNPEYAEDLSGSDDELLSSTGPSDTRGRKEENSYGTTSESTPATSGTSTPALLRGGSPPRNLSDSLDYDNLTQSHHPEARKYSTDPVFTTSQLFQLHQLNALPQLRKHFVYLPKSRNSHGAIVRRSPEWEQHRIGTQVVDWWAKQFVL